MQRSFLRKNKCRKMAKNSVNVLFVFIWKNMFGFFTFSLIVSE